MNHTNSSSTLRDNYILNLVGGDVGGGNNIHKESSQEEGTEKPTIKETVAKMFSPKTAIQETQNAIQENFQRSDISLVQSYRSPGIIPVLDKVVKIASGIYVYTTDGEKYLDFTGGIGYKQISANSGQTWGKSDKTQPSALSTGHCHPKVTAAIKEQTDKCIHSAQMIFGGHTAMVELYERFYKIMPQYLDSYFLCNSGSEATDNALKIARAYTRRSSIISFKGGFHGRTYGALSVTASKSLPKAGFGPMGLEVIFSDFPMVYECEQDNPQYNAAYEIQRAKECFDNIFKQIVRPEDVAAVIIEPIQGEGGFIAAPEGFLKYIQDICREHGIVYIIDEVQSGAARTGEWWAFQHYANVEPDMITYAKGIASGFPFSGIASRKYIQEKLVKGSMGGTYGGNNIACAASCATIDTIQEENLLVNAKQLGDYLKQQLLEIKKEIPQIMDVRGKGLMVAVEFKEPGNASKIVKEALQRNIVFLTAGPKDVIRFLPPLIIKKEEIDEGLKLFKESIQAVFQESAIERPLSKLSLFVNKKSDQQA